MSDAIVNRVAQSNLITIDLEDYYPEGPRTHFDISQWLYEGLILKEKDFREAVQNHNWSQYKGNFVALTCTADAIIPSWAYMLITTHLVPYASKIIVGSLEQLETALFQEVITNLPMGSFKDKPIIIKGCAHRPIPETAYTLLIEKLFPIAKSIMFGEACSTVPLYKSKK